MPNDLRNTNMAVSDMDMRNFRILKDYVNALEYYADGFTYFGTALQKKSSSPTWYLLVSTERIPVEYVAQPAFHL